MGSLLSSDDGKQANATNSDTSTQATIISDSPAITTKETAPTNSDTGTATSLDDLSAQSGMNKTILDDKGLINGTANSFEDFKINLFGTDYQPLRWMTLSTLYSWLGPLSSACMIIGCALPYVPQYATIYKNRNCDGFSTFVCLTLLLSNILRIAFWFGHPFELPLIIQSIIMIITQLLLLDLCIRVRKENSYSHTPKRKFLSFNPRHFWRWTDIASYIEFLILLSILLGLSIYFLIDCKPYIEAVGYCALVIESMLGLPQVIKNYQNKSVVGMSLSMVLMWLAGDTFKTGYYISNDVPFQFWLCGISQITIDLLILFQVCLYRQGAPLKMSTQMEIAPRII